MPRKLKFRPRITRIKLNPEQAVLACNCYDGYLQAVWHPTRWPDLINRQTVCNAGSKGYQVAGIAWTHGGPGGFFPEGHNASS